MIGSLAAVRARVVASPLVHRFLGGAAWGVVGAVASSGVTLLTLMFVARFLSKETYGQLVVLQSTLSMVGVFAGLGIGMAATRYTAELRVVDRARLGRILSLGERSIVGFGVLALAGLAVSANWLAAVVLNAPTLGLPLSFAAVIVLFSALDAFQKSVLVGLESMKAFAVGSTIASCLSFPIVLAAASNYDLPGAVIGLVIASLIQASVSRYQMMRELKKQGIVRHAERCLDEWRFLLHFALPAMMSGALVGPVHWAAQAILANTTNGYTELAVLGIAMQWFNLILFVPGSAGRVVLPILTDYVTRNDRGNSRNILLLAMSANAIITVPLALLIGVFSPQIMSLYGKGYEADHVALVLSASIAALVAVQVPVGSLLAARSRLWLGSLMNLGWALVYLTAACALAYKGAAGILMALGAGYIIHIAWVGRFAMCELRKLETPNEQANQY